MATDAGVRNVDELRTFGKQIQQLGVQMYNVMVQAQQRMNQVCEGWHDANNDKFKARFDESVHQIKKMSEEFNEYNMFLSKTCDILDMYKDLKMKI